MTKDLRAYAGKAPPHLCMDGHEPIGHWDSGDDERCPLCRANDRLSEAVSRIGSMQAQIDALMLEYCPDEMTPEQLAEWQRHQVVVEMPK